MALVPRALGTSTRPGTAVDHRPQALHDIPHSIRLSVQLLCCRCTLLRVGRAALRYLLHLCNGPADLIDPARLRQMRPAEILGRWGNNEFLVLAHERTSALLVEHGRRLAGLARTADFRWWGDRVGLTVSIGASHATDGDTLQSLLNRARHAMHCSAYAGGNQVTEARES
jgi:hypothetical protein